MATRMGVMGRPAPTADHASPSRARPVGVGIGVIGVGLLTATLIANLGAAADVGEDAVSVRETLAWSFGLTTMGLATVKFGIATVLMGILQRLWLRVESVKAALPELRGQSDGGVAPTGEIDTPYGAGVASTVAPGPLPIHRIARLLWTPMLAMGVMAVGTGLVLSLIQSSTSDGEDFRDLGAWVQGTQFLGEAFLLAGISFLLGSILGALREGGGEVQEATGRTVQTLKMPLPAKAFIALMAMAMMTLLAAIILHFVFAADIEATATSLEDAEQRFVVLEGVRRIGVGVYLFSILLGLATIVQVLRFQSVRIRELPREQRRAG